jgi:hypothetical protein
VSRHEERGRTVVRAANGPELKLDEGIDVRDGRGELLHHAGRRATTREREGGVSPSDPFSNHSQPLTSRHGSTTPRAVLHDSDILIRLRRLKQHE